MFGAGTFVSGAALSAQTSLSSAMNVGSIKLDMNNRTIPVANHNHNNHANNRMQTPPLVPIPDISSHGLPHDLSQEMSAAEAMKAVHTVEAMNVAAKKKQPLVLDGMVVQNPMENGNAMQPMQSMQPIQPIQRIQPIQPMSTPPNVENAHSPPSTSTTTPCAAAGVVAKRSVVPDGPRGDVGPPANNSLFRPTPGHNPAIQERSPWEQFGGLLFCGNLKIL